MIERVFSIETIQKGEAEGTLMIMLRDKQYDSVIMLTIPSNDFSKLGVFPGADVKITIEKA